MSKKAIHIKIRFFTGIIAITLLVGCQKAKIAETMPFQINDSVVANETNLGSHVVSEVKVQKANTDYGYKMLYGEWLVEKKIGESYRLDVQDVSDIIGKTFAFSREQAVFYFLNEEIEIDYPEYKITVIPLDEQTTYFPYMPTLNEIGINGSYVTIFSVGYDIYFILKDDETVIIFYKDAYLELRRTGYIDGYEAEYSPL